MKKLLLILTILTALLLAGCTGTGYQGDQCINNDVCSVKEEKIGGCNDCVVEIEGFKVISNDVFSDEFYDCKHEACKYTSVCLCKVPSKFPDYPTCYEELKEKDLTEEDEFYQEAYEKINQLDLSLTNCQETPTMVRASEQKDGTKNAMFWSCYNDDTFHYLTAINYVDDTFYVCNYWRGE